MPSAHEKARLAKKEGGGEEERGEKGG